MRSSPQRFAAGRDRLFPRGKTAPGPRLGRPRGGASPWCSLLVECAGHRTASAVLVCQIGLVNICTISTDVTAKEASLRRMTETCAERLLSGRYSVGGDASSAVGCFSHQTDRQPLCVTVKLSRRLP